MATTIKIFQEGSQFLKNKLLKIFSSGRFLWPPQNDFFNIAAILQEKKVLQKASFGKEFFFVSRKNGD